MNTKLTLSLDDKIIVRAKKIARRQGKSLSKLVEEYFSSFPEKKENLIVERLENRTRPYLSKLNLPEGKDYREIAREWKHQNRFE